MNEHRWQTFVIAYVKKGNKLTMGNKTEEKPHVKGMYVKCR